MIKKRVCSFALVVLILLLLVLPGCTNQESTANKLVVYIEYNGALGTEDDAVEKAIEEKFFQDTGIELDLQVEAVGTDMIGQKIVTARADTTQQIDGIVTHYGSDAPINT